MPLVPGGSKNVKPKSCSYSYTENVETGANTRRQINFGTGVLLVHRARNS